MRSIDALQSKHEQLVSNQLTMKMEIHNLFTDFAKSIVDGIEAVTSMIVVNQFNHSATPQSDMKNDEGHATTPIPINFESGITPAPQKKTTKLAACIRSPFTKEARNTRKKELRRKAGKLRDGRQKERHSQRNEKCGNNSKQLRMKQLNHKEIADTISSGDVSYNDIPTTSNHNNDDADCCVGLI
ncbi:Uncharacterized protein Fot_03986 [Forsythia ovata]|uniref:Uncharacterized protein n=1 Tax=Forsythia ovata TaxID=205694 RepID=A0ABD1XBS9_9LAMI